MTWTQPGDTTVLVVDDEQPLADLYTTWLDDRYTVRTAYGGDEALELLDDDVDLVLLDRRMPGTSGDEVLEAIHERGYGCQVVMVTAVQPDFGVIELGFDGYLVKPIDRGDLHEMVEQTLARAAYEERLRDYYALEERRSTLEALAADGDVEGDEEYAAIEERLADTRERIDAVLSEFEDPNVTAAIEQTQTVATLRESEARYRSMTEDVLDTSEVGTVVLDADFRVVWANEAIERYFGIDRGALLDQDYRDVVRDDLAPAVADREAFEGRMFEALDDNTGVEEFGCRVRPDGDGDGDYWLKHWSKPIETGLYAGGRIEHYYDVTALKDRERTLETLHAATRRMINAETETEAAEIAIETADERLDLAAVLYLRDESSGALRPVAHTADMTDVADEADDGRIWEVFVDGEAALPGDDGELLLPLRSHGVLRIGDPDADGFSDADVTFAQTLAANAEVAMGRAERERELRERDRQLKERNEQLQQLNRVNTVIRSIGRALVNASSRADIEQAVCDRLTSVSSYDFVWIGEPDAVHDELVPQAWAGAEQGYLDSIRMADGDGIEYGPAWEAVRTREPVAVQNILDDPDAERWRSEALKRRYQSVAAVPLVYEESVYGTLEVFSGRPLAFDDEEQAVLAELGETIGHAINAVKRKEALLTDSGIELEFDLDGADDFFVRLAEHGAGQLDLQTVIPQSDGSSVAFVAAEGATPDQIRSLTDRSTAVTDVQLIRENGEGALFKCRIGEPAIVTTVADYGAVPRSVTADSDGTSVVVVLPQTRDVRSFVETFTEQYPDAELVARREQPLPSESRSFHERLDDRLTDRQKEVLQAAYFAGYFDWPREQTGEDVADTLDISQPTFQQHLRAGERHLLEVLFEGR